MKCIKNNKTGNITRVGNDTAQQSVKAGTHTFCPKHEWKASKG